MLASAGFPDVHGVTRNVEAFAALKEQRFDLILCDLNRPGGTGEELISAVRADSAFREVQVLVLTGDPRQERELACWRSGANGFLAKPVSSLELVTKIDELLNRTADPDHRLIDLGLESRELDYKEALDLSSSTSRAELAKDFIAFANSGGGVIVVGVAEASPGEFRATGIPEEQAASLEITRLSDALRKYIGPTVSFTSRVVRRAGLTHVVIRIRAADEALAFPLTPNQNAGLHLGRIYARTEDARSTEIVDTATLSQVLERIVKSRVSLALGHFATHLGYFRDR